MKYLSKINFVHLLLVLFINTIGICQSNVFRVTLDAGHGAHDFGANYNGRVEKNINLELVLKVGAILEKIPKIDVIYTRKTDVFIDLVERASIANRSDSHIFVSIHCNANRNTAAFGTETYVMGMSKVASNLEAAKKENAVITLEKNYQQKYEGFDINSPETMIGMTLMQEEYLDNSISLASKIQDLFAAEGRAVRHGGVKQAPFMVLHKAYMPRVLIETGFISNSTEGNFLNSEEGQKVMALAIANAIVSYKKDYFDTTSSETRSEISVKKITRKPTSDSLPKKPAVELPAVDNPKIIFKIQLAVSKKKLTLISTNFKGLKNVVIVPEGKLYRYIYGETKDYEEAKKLLLEVKNRGYGTAFVIAYKDGEIISVQDALK